MLGCFRRLHEDLGFFHTFGYNNPHSQRIEEMPGALWQCYGPPSALHHEGSVSLTLNIRYTY